MTGDCTSSPILICLSLSFPNRVGLLLVLYYCLQTNASIFLLSVGEIVCIVYCVVTNCVLPYKMKKKVRVWLYN